MTEHNPAAFPIKQPMTNDFLGMSLLDHFAGLAMQGLFASDSEHWNEEGDWESRAHAAYSMADAMLRERTKWIK